MEQQVWLPASLPNMRYMENTCHLYNRDGTQSNLVKSSSEILPKNLTEVVRRQGLLE